MELKRLVVVALVPMLLAMAEAQAPAPSVTRRDYNCSDRIALLPSPVHDPCTGTTAYAELGSCATFMSGNVTTPSAECCTSAKNVWSKSPACFCKVTFLSKFSSPGPALARARPLLCNITDDLCNTCPSYFTDPTVASCAAEVTFKIKSPEPDPCSNTSAYSELGKCADFMNGNNTVPSGECCTSAQSVWSKFPACFCKVTFFSKFQPPGAHNALARPGMCNITDDLCHICPRLFGSTS